jgi:hypothetical protein
LIYARGALLALANHLSRISASGCIIGYSSAPNSGAANKTNIEIISNFFNAISLERDTQLTQPYKPDPVLCGYSEYLITHYLVTEISNDPPK